MAELKKLATSPTKSPFSWATHHFGLIKTSYKATAALVTALDVALFESKPLPNP